MMKKVFFLLMLWPAVALPQPSYNMTLFSNLDLPNLPTRFGSEYNDCWGFKHSNGTEIAIIGGIESIFFVDVTAPANPVVIYTHNVVNLGLGTNQSLWRDFKTYGNYAYASADEGTSGLLVFDLSQVPTSVTMVNQTTSYWTRTHNIFIDEEHGRLYAAGSNTVSNGLVILNLTGNPAFPALLANVPLNTVGGGYCHDVYVRDNIAYCSHGNLGKVQMYDFSNLPSFTVVGSIENYPEVGYNHSSWLNSAGNLLTMVDETHGSDIKLVDVTDPLNISNDDINTFKSELLGPLSPASIAHNPFILGDLAFIAYYHDGVQVFDISDPEDIDIVAYYDTYPINTTYNDYKGCWGVYPFLPSGIIIASDQNYGLYVMEITDMTLDIEFLSFQAYRQNDGIKLKWSVMDATFGNTFEVKRSSEGGITFQTVGKVKLSEGQYNYDFMDLTVSSQTRYVYRIDFIQLDGSSVKSPIRYVRSEAGPATLRVNNPVASTLVLDILKPIETLDLKLYNLNGQVVWTYQSSDPKAKMEFTLPDVPAGQFVLVANWIEGSENLIIQKVK